VLPRYRNKPFHTMQRGDYFGYEDILYNCQLSGSELDVENLPEYKDLGNRQFTVYSEMVCETLVLNVDDIRKTGYEFPATALYLKE
jgi:CRP-like cAMP-binding protein